MGGGLGRKPNGRGSRGGREGQQRTEEKIERGRRTQEGAGRRMNRRGRSQGRMRSERRE